MMYKFEAGDIIIGNGDNKIIGIVINVLYYDECYSMLWEYQKSSKVYYTNSMSFVDCSHELHSDIFKGELY